MIYVVLSNITTDVNVYKLCKSTTALLPTHTTIVELSTYNDDIKRRKKIRSSAKLDYREIVPNRDQYATGELLVNRTQQSLKLAIQNFGCFTRKRVVPYSIQFKFRKRLLQRCAAMVDHVFAKHV